MTVYPANYTATKAVLALAADGLANDIEFAVEYHGSPRVYRGSVWKNGQPRDLFGYVLRRSGNSPKENVDECDDALCDVLGLESPNHLDPTLHDAADSLAHQSDYAVRCSGARRRRIMAKALRAFAKSLG